MYITSIEVKLQGRRKFGRHKTKLGRSGSRTWNGSWPKNVIRRVEGGHEMSRF